MIKWEEAYDEMREKGPLKIYYPICGGHMECVQACPLGDKIWEVIEVEIKGKVKRRPFLKSPEECLQCFKCLGACPTGALMKSEDPEPERPLLHAIKSLFTFRKRRKALKSP